ncbi:MAG: preprotein translocase subunit YajC [Pirellulales bacterium]
MSTPMSSVISLLAQADVFSTMLVPFLLIAVLFYFMLIRPERRKQMTHRAMLDALKKNDRVITIGGLKGSVVSVRREADEVTIKVDENTKLRFTISAIARVETGEPVEESAAPTLSS